MEALELPGFWILLKIWTWIRDFVLSLACPSLIPDTDKFGAKIKATWEIPGPTIWRPVLGDALTLNKFGGPEKLLDYISSLHEKYGPIFKYVMQICTCTLCYRGQRIRILSRLANFLMIF